MGITLSLYLRPYSSSLSFALTTLGNFFGQSLLGKNRIVLVHRATLAVNMTKYYLPTRQTVASFAGTLERRRLDTTLGFPVCCTSETRAVPGARV